MKMEDEYAEFLERKSQRHTESGFSPTFLPDSLFDFQRALVEWAVQKGRAAVFADCGLGKTLIQLVWAQNIVEHTNKRVLVLTPLAVGEQTLQEGARFGVECVRSRDGIFPPGAKIVITNYEKLHLFEPKDFAGAVCDESSILKHFSGATQQAVTRFISKMDYRSLYTATAAPNDYVELGTSSQALGYLGHSDMLTRFFRQTDGKSHQARDESNARKAQTNKHFQRLSFRVSQQIGQWRLKGHAESHFWDWVCSWARACRMPSDLGFSDSRFSLPSLTETPHIIDPKTPGEGLLFSVPAVGLKAEREERRRTLNERCELAASLVSHDRPAVIWCHLNDEGDLLAKLIPDSRQVRGSTSDEDKENIYNNFAGGSLRVLIIKPKIGAWGLNWQHCADVVQFASHSYEQYYQSIRRCWRFGQDHPVKVDIIATTGEAHVVDNMNRKKITAGRMFDRLVAHMNQGRHITEDNFTVPMEVPSWLEH